MVGSSIFSLRERDSYSGADMPGWRTCWSEGRAGCGEGVGARVRTIGVVVGRRQVVDTL